MKKIIYLVIGLTLLLQAVPVQAYNANFVDTVLSAGYISNPYYSTIRFTYDGPNSPSAIIAGLPSGINVGGAGYGNGVYGIAKGSDGYYSVVLTGTPTQSGNFTVTVQVFDTTHTVDISREFILNIQNQSLDLVTTSLPNATVGSYYSADIVFNYSGSYCINGTLTGLPAGVSVYGAFAATPNQLSCLMGSQSFKIFGTPTVGGNYLVQVYLTNNSGVSVSKNLNLAVGYAGTPGALSTNKLSFDFSLPTGYSNTSNDSAIITNVSNSTAYFYISVLNQPTWLNTSYNTAEQMVLSPGQTMGIGASVNPTGLSAGNYSSKIYLTGSFSGSPLILPVNLSVYSNGNSGTGNSNSEVGRIPLIRLYNSKTNKHNYTTSRNEAGVLEGQGWRIEGELGYVYVSSATDTEPIYRLYHSRQKKYFYTTSLDEKEAVLLSGYKLIEIIGYMPKYSTVGLETQVYRLYSPKANDHFYTTNYQERDSAVASGYRWEGGFGGRLFISPN